LLEANRLTAGEKVENQQKKSFFETHCGRGDVKTMQKSSAVRVDTGDFLQFSGVFATSDKHVTKSRTPQNFCQGETLDT